MDESSATDSDSSHRKFTLAVLNPGGKDAEQAFPDFAGEPNAGGHAPINFHAWAACTQGSFHAKTTNALATGSPILLLLRGDLKNSLQAFTQIKNEDPTRPVAVCLKETGTHQVTGLLSRKGTLTRFQEITKLADGCLCATPFPVALFRSLRSDAGLKRDPKTVQFIPTPYPVGDDRWNFSQPVVDRTGILLGTREFATLSRNHLLALIALKRFDVPITVMNADGRTGRRLLRDLDFPPNQLKIVEGKFHYTNYLRWMAGHRLVFQLDQSHVPGQVAGDALLCRMICVGGNGIVDQLAFPEFSGELDHLETRLEQVEQLLTDDAFYNRALEESRDQATSQLSFPVVTAQLQMFFERLRQNIQP